VSQTIAPLRRSRAAGASSWKSVDVRLTRADARRIWLHAQRLDELTPFGDGPEATPAAVKHLGYVQIDTINVIERCHHHILWSRIPSYERAHLHQAQTIDKSLFEYWTHALSYVPVDDFRFFVREMRRHRASPKSWFGSVTKSDVRKVLNLIHTTGPLSIRDIDDEKLVEKHHPWASRKPSKRALQVAFYAGLLTVSERSGMLKTYELMDRHFGWEKPPKAASEREVDQYLLDRAIRAQGIVSLDSICYLDAKRKLAVRQLIESRVRLRGLVPITLEGAEKIEHWGEASVVEAAAGPTSELVHILSPFDPLIIQRKRLKLFFGYDHRFEAYVPKEKRMVGYFALPVLVGAKIVAAIDLKADRASRTLIVKKWTWLQNGASRSFQTMVDEALHRFETFQFAP
jgi:uncharacterized protein YcaQ